MCHSVYMLRIGPKERDYVGSPAVDLYNNALLNSILHTNISGLVLCLQSVLEGDKEKILSYMYWYEDQ